MKKKVCGIILIISIFMVAFVGLASFLIYKFAPKTFKIKQ